MVDDAWNSMLNSVVLAFGIRADTKRLNCQEDWSMAFTTSAVIDGVCHGFTFYNSQMTKTILGVCYFVFFYVVMFVLFVFCYGRILVSIRRQARVMAGHTTGTAASTAAQAQRHQIQSNVIRLQRGPEYTVT